MLKKETFEFLKDISENNDRVWFAEHKGEYENARLDLLNLVAEIIPKLSLIDPNIPDTLDPKKCVMRIYRDIRFSINKAPYKTNFGVWFSANKGGDEPGYYLHIQPGKSFMAAGYWMPTPDHLKLIRQEIDYNASNFIKIIESEGFKSVYTLNYNESLKKAPKGYDINDPNIQYLKLKSFEAVSLISDSDFYKSDFTDNLIKNYKKAYPLVAFLRDAIQN